MPDASLQSDPAVQSDAERSKELFEHSKTFMMRTPEPRVMKMRLFTVIGLLLLFFAVIPLLIVAGIVPDYKINILGQYLCFAIVALGIDLIWGYTGLLSLCQALFFTLGGYAMGMHLSLPEGGGQYDYPQFMTFAYYGHGTNLPWFWQPFRHFWFAVFAGLAVPGLVAGLFGFFILRNRVRGVYFSIITQALAAASWLLISRNEMLLGGTNGLTNFYRPMTADRSWKIGLYLLTLVVLAGAYLFCRVIVKSRLGRVLVAVRDKETRLYFAGYKPYAFKVFAFSIAGMLAGLGGMLYSPQMSIITPQEMNVEASILMAVMVALGGRGRLWGAVFGAILFRTLRSSLSSDLQEGWLLVEGLIAVVVVLVFPDGFAGIWEKMERQVTTGQGYGRVALTSAPLVTVGLYVICEALGLMPRFLNESSLHLTLYKWLLLLLALAAWAGVLCWRQRKWMGRVVVAANPQSWAVSFNWSPRKSERKWRGIITLLAIDAVLIVVFACGFTPASLRDAMHVEIQLKYALILVIFAACAIVHWVDPQFGSPTQGRGFEVIEPAVPLAAMAGKDA